MKGFLAAWVVGESVYIWREVHRTHGLPVPGILLGITGLFAGLAVVAEIFPASAQVVTLTAWGLDVAGFFSAIGGGLGQQIGQAEAQQAKLFQAKTGA